LLIILIGIDQANRFVFSYPW